MRLSHFKLLCLFATLSMLSMLQQLVRVMNFGPQTTGKYFDSVPRSVGVLEKTPGDQTTTSTPGAMRFCLLSRLILLLTSQHQQQQQTQSTGLHVFKVVKRLFFSEVRKTVPDHHKWILQFGNGTKESPRVPRAEARDSRWPSVFQAQWNHVEKFTTNFRLKSQNL